MKITSKSYLSLKAQGGEADNVVFVHQENHSISRNMMYTAVTRAKKTVTLIGSKAGWEEAVNCIEQPTYTKFAFWFKAAERNANKVVPAMSKEPEGEII